MPKANPQTAPLCNNLPHYRRQRNMTQQELATLTGVSRHTIVNIEGNRSLPSILLAFHLAEALGVPVTELFHP